MNGIYVMYFTGAAGSGEGLILLKDGILAGADGGGVLYDGTYKISEDGENLAGSISVNVPPGVGLVTGATAGSEPLKFELPLSLPTSLGEGRSLTIRTPTGPLNIIFKRLRSIE